MPYAAILLPRAVDTPFDYRIPEGMELMPGHYVCVPFGRTEEWGVVWQMLSTPSIAEEKIRQVVAASTLPPMSEHMRRFIAWVAHYTMTPMGNVLAMAMRVPQIFEKDRVYSPRGVIATAQHHFALSEEQNAAVRAVTAACDAGAFQAFLLDGITGSGKTEVYAESIAHSVQQQKQALVLVPEIALTDPLVKRLEARLGLPALSWHSGITPKQRAERWQAVVRGEARLIVGARSALFLPYAKLGLMVVDEEHDHSFKQEEGVLYQARDMAVARAHQECIPIVLASATPSLESVANCENGKYTKLLLTTRHGSATLPSISAIDMRTQRLEAGQFLAPELLQALQENLARGEQSLLFLNRRGYAPLTLCRACGHRLQCPNCTAWMVQHKTTGRLQCHHCGYHARALSACPSCKTEDALHPVGPGVERLQEEVAQKLPEAKLLLFTSDHVHTPKQVQSAIAAIEQGKIDILIGTQMIAKGHHFPNLTLVGVVDADLGLEGGDLRASERAFQMITQVSGRAGREAKKGRVLLQSFQPEHPVIAALIAGDRTQFLKEETSLRKQAGVPPFGKFAALVFTGKDESAVRSAALQYRNAAPPSNDLRIFGPAPAPLSKLKGKFRYRLLVHGKKNAPLQRYITAWHSRTTLPSTISLKIDIDPYSFN